MISAFFYGSFSSKSLVSFSQESSPKSSVGEINLNTPENRTYIEPDFGYYPSTYGFESGTQGFEINDLGGSAEVINSLAGHNKVMALSDTNPNYRIDVRQIFRKSTQSYGTIEFWLRTTDHGSSKQQYISFVRGTGQWDESDYLFAIVMNLYGWNNRGDRVINEVPSLEDNTWFHCRMDFECTSGKYTGLDQYHWRFTVNGIPSDPLPFLNQFDGMDFILFQTGTDPYGMTLYIDSIGYSWEPDYNIGDNLNEGLLLSYDSTTTLEWQGYSLDGADNITISGDSVIPFPVDGSHTIQVSGNDSLGNSYQSNLRFFLIDGTLPYISILAPAQYTYFSWEAPYFQITTSGDNLSTTYYQIDDFTVFCQTHQGQINQALWETCDEGLVVISFYVNNTSGNCSMAELTVYKDTISPYISTEFTYEGRVYDSSAPYFYLNLYDANIDLKWYTLNDDFTKNYFMGEHLGIGQTLWDNLDDGIIYITLYATDKAGNANNLSFYVIKDTSMIYPYTPTYYPPYLAIAIGGILFMGIVVTIIVIVLNKNSQPRPRTSYHDRSPYYSPVIRPKQPEYSVPKRMLKCPYCSNEEDIDGNFCPQCGARFR